MGEAIERSRAMQTPGFRRSAQFDATFPRRCKAIPSAPAVIYFRGSPQRVGAARARRRRDPQATSFGESATQKLTAAPSRPDSPSSAASRSASTGSPTRRRSMQADGPLRCSARASTGQPSPAPRTGRPHSRQRRRAALRAALRDRSLSRGRSSRATGCRRGSLRHCSSARPASRGGRCTPSASRPSRGSRSTARSPTRRATRARALRRCSRRPATSCPSVLPAWAKAGSLAKKLGSSPLARPVRSDAVEEWIAELTGNSAELEPSTRLEEAGQLPLDGM